MSNIELSNNQNKSQLNDLTKLLLSSVEPKKIDGEKVMSGNFERMCHDAPANNFVFRWSN